VSLNSVQILRAAAAIAVLLYHATLWTAPVPGMVIGAAGVDLFFVISGFIMVYASERLFGQRGAARYFLVRRIVRIVPLYWGLTTLIVLWHGFPPNLLGSYLFIPLIRGPILTVGWTLNYEMMFYGLFAAAIALQKRTAVIVLSIILVGLVTVPSAIGLVLQTPWKDWTSPLLVEFVFGMLIGLAFSEGWRLHPTMSCAVIVLAAATLAAAQFHGLVDVAAISSYARLLTWGTGAALIVAAIVLTDTRREIPFLLKPAVPLGDASYALYLCHPIVFSLMTAIGITKLIDPTIHPHACAAAFVTLAIIAALIINRVDEAVRKWLLARFAVGLGRPPPHPVATAPGSYSQAPQRALQT
jgi:exopolysaccharide production protein ExoZ